MTGGAWLAFAAQTILIVGFGAWLMRGQTLGNITLVAMLAIMAGQWAIARGVPFWTDWAFGDAYDLAVIVWLGLALVLSSRS